MIKAKRVPQAQPPKKDTRQQERRWWMFGDEVAIAMSAKPAKAAPKAS